MAIARIVCCIDDSVGVSLRLSARWFKRTIIQASSWNVLKMWATVFDLRGSPTCDLHHPLGTYRNLSVDVKYYIYTLHPYKINVWLHTYQSALQECRTTGVPLVQRNLPFMYCFQFFKWRPATTHCRCITGSGAEPLTIFSLPSHEHTANHDCLLPTLIAFGSCLRSLLDSRDSFSQNTWHVQQLDQLIKYIYVHIHLLGEHPQHHPGIHPWT